MPFTRPRPIPAPERDGADVAAGVVRFEGFDERGEASLIRPPDAPRAGAATGPDGFSVSARRLSAGERLEITDPEHHTVVHVARGEVRAGDADTLRPYDALLVAPARGTTITAGDAECVLILTRYRERDERGHWSDRGRARAGIARLAAIRPIRERVPLRFAERLLHVLSPRDLYAQIGPQAHGPGRFAVQGPDGLVSVVATTPPGTGPTLHVHTLSIEMFVVLEGAFRVYWGERGESEACLGALDGIVIPRGVNRGFEALGPGPDWILPLVVGANDEREDIAWLPPVADALYAAGPTWLARLALTAGLVRIRPRAGG